MRYIQGRTGGKKTRLSWIFSRDPLAAGLLEGCPVLTAAGEKLGNVSNIMADMQTHQVRYVMLSCKGNKAPVAIPWQALYFDSSLASLVFYTYA